MLHPERHSWMRLVAWSGSLLLAGCASVKTTDTHAAPLLGGESPSLYGSPEGIGGPRTLARKPTFPAVEQTSGVRREGDDDIVLISAEGSPSGEVDGNVTQTMFPGKKKRLRAGMCALPAESTPMPMPMMEGAEAPVMMEEAPPSGAPTVVEAPMPGGLEAPPPADGPVAGGPIAAGKTKGRHAKKGKKGPSGQEELDAAGANLTSRKHLRGDMGSNPLSPRELRMVQHPLYVVEPPDVLYIEALELLPNRPIAGERLVRQDGTISLGYYGQISVSGLTLPEIEKKLRDVLSDYVNAPEVYVDVASFNSKVFYVLGQVQQTGRLPITGKETVLDGITLAGGITNFADVNRIYLARPNPGGGCDQVFHIDWQSITRCGDTRTNYQLLPGDRIYVTPTKGYQTTVAFDNYLTPVERITNVFALFRFATTRTQ